MESLRSILVLLAEYPYAATLVAVVVVLLGLPLVLTFCIWFLGLMGFQLELGGRRRP